MVRSLVSEADFKVLSTKVDQILQFIKEHKESHQELEGQVSEIQREKSIDVYWEKLKSVVIFCLAGITSSLATYIWLTK